MNENNNNVNGVLGALGYGALPQSVVPITKTQTQMQRTQYDPNKLKTLMDALGAPKAVPGMGETLANALAAMENPQAFTGGFGEQIIDPWSTGLTALARGFGTTYGARKAAERDAAETARENAIKAAQLDAEASKQAVTSQVASDYLKVNDPNAGGNTAYRFEPERINDLKELNDKAGRWATEWGKGVSDILSSDQSKAYNEFEGKAKQYVQDQLKKIYGAQMTEAEGERFFKSMGLSPYLAPDLRWKLVESALDDLARKNNTTIKPQNTAIDDFMKGTK